MKKRKIASFAVSPQLIQELLKIPNDHEIFGAEWDFQLRALRLFVEGPSLPEVEPNQTIPIVTPSVSEEIGKDGKPAYTWSWNLPNNRAP